MALFKRKVVYIIYCELNSNSEKQSYILGTFDDINAAKTIAGGHYFDRGGKYKITIYKSSLNKVNFNGCEIVYEIDK